MAWLVGHRETERRGNRDATPIVTAPVVDSTELRPSTIRPIAANNGCLKNNTRAFKETPYGRIEKTPRRYRADHWSVIGNWRGAGEVLRA